MSEELVIKVRGLVNAFGDQVIHDQLDLDVRKGEILGVVGGSGTGKSVLMRSIIGLQPFQSGEVEIFGQPVDVENVQQSLDLRRRWGVLFQNGALFSTLTVAENVQVPLREFYKQIDAKLLDEIATFKIAMTGLPTNAAPKYPSELSGGMRKRAGLARALALDPLLLFLDEPTAGLDPIGAAAFDELILELREALGLTVFLITHDLDSLYAICDRVAVLADKKVIATGTIDELLALDHPWIQEYFNGARGRAAVASAERGTDRHMENRSNQLLVGIVVLLLLIAVAGFSVWLARLGSGSDETYDIFFSQSVDGLARGSSVTYSGVPVGQVDEIALLPDNPEFVRVRILVGASTPILEGTTATISGVGFTGVSQISLGGGVQGAEPIDEAGPYGAPVIPTRPGAFGELLNSAPRLLERLSTLTERLTELLGDRNQNSIAAILDNTSRLTSELAERGQDISATLADTRVAIRQAGDATEQIGRLANTSDRLLNQEGAAAMAETRALISDLRGSVEFAENSLNALERSVSAAEPGLNAFSQRTVPEIGQLTRDLRQMTDSLTEVSERLNNEGAGSLLGSPALPDYEPQ